MGKLKKKKTGKMDKQQLYNTIVRHNLKDLTQLSHLANIQLCEGKVDLHSYIMSTISSKARQDMLVDTAWSIENAPELMKQRVKSRMDIIQEALEKDCRDE